MWATVMLTEHKDTRPLSEDFMDEMLQAHLLSECCSKLRETGRQRDGELPVKLFREKKDKWGNVSLLANRMNAPFYSSKLCWQLTSHFLNEAKSVSRRFVHIVF